MFAQLANNTCPTFNFRDPKFLLIKDEYFNAIREEMSKRYEEAPSIGNLRKKHRLRILPDFSNVKITSSEYKIIKEIGIFDFLERLSVGEKIRLLTGTRRASDYKNNNKHLSSIVKVSELEFEGNKAYPSSMELWYIKGDRCIILEHEFGYDIDVLGDDTPNYPPKGWSVREYVQWHFDSKVDLPDEPIDPPLHEEASSYSDYYDY